MEDIITYKMPAFDLFTSIANGDFIIWLQDYVSQMSPFAGVDFSLLYSWTPFTGTCAAIIGFSVFMWILGLIHKLPML